MLLLISRPRLNPPKTQSVCPTTQLLCILLASLSGGTLDHVSVAIEYISIEVYDRSYYGSIPAMTKIYSSA